MSVIQVQPGSVLSRFSGRPFGINVNYCRDHDSNRPGARRQADQPAGNEETEPGGKSHGRGAELGEA